MSNFKMSPKNQFTLKNISNVLGDIENVECKLKKEADGTISKSLVAFIEKYQKELIKFIETYREKTADDSKFTFVFFDKNKKSFSYYTKKHPNAKFISVSGNSTIIYNKNGNIEVFFNDNIEKKVSIENNNVFDTIKSEKKIVSSVNELKDFIDKNPSLIIEFYRGLEGFLISVELDKNGNLFISRDGGNTDLRDSDMLFNIYDKENPIEWREFYENCENKLDVDKLYPIINGKCKNADAIYFFLVTNPMLSHESLIPTTKSELIYIHATKKVGLKKFLKESNISKNQKLTLEEAENYLKCGTGHSDHFLSSNLAGEAINVLFFNNKHELVKNYRVTTENYENRIAGHDNRSYLRSFYKIMFNILESTKTFYIPNGWKTMVSDDKNDSGKFNHNFNLFNEVFESIVNREDYLQKFNFEFVYDVQELGNNIPNLNMVAILNHFLTFNIEKIHSMNIFKDIDLLIRHKFNTQKISYNSYFQIFEEKFIKNNNFNEKMIDFELKDEEFPPLNGNNGNNRNDGNNDNDNNVNRTPLTKNNSLLEKYNYSKLFKTSSWSESDDNDSDDNEHIQEIIEITCESDENNVDLSSEFVYPCPDINESVEIVDKLRESDEALYCVDKSNERLIDKIIIDFGDFITNLLCHKNENFIINYAKKVINIINNEFYESCVDDTMKKNFYITMISGANIDISSIICDFHLYNNPTEVKWGLCIGQISKRFEILLDEFKNFQGKE